MRPHRPTAKSRGTSLARARSIFLDGLDWLRGHPVAGAKNGTLRWRAVPEPTRRADLEEIVVDRERIRKATFCAKKLYREFPRVLPRLVGDRDKWFTAVCGELEILKRRIHRGEPLLPVRELLDELELSPGRRGRVIQIAGVEPALVPVLRALVWIHASQPAELTKAVTWVKREHFALRAIAGHFDAKKSLELILRLTDLAIHGEAKRLKPLLTSLGDARLHRVAIEHDRSAKDVVSAARKRTLAFAPSPPGGAEQLANVVRQLTAMEPARRRSYLECLSPLLPDSSLDEWSSWWGRMEGACRALRKKASSEDQHYHADARSKLRRLERRIVKVVEDAPNSESFSDTLSTVDRLSRCTSSRVRLLTRVLTVLPRIARRSPRARDFRRVLGVDLRSNDRPSRRRGSMPSSVSRFRAR